MTYFQHIILYILLCLFSTQSIAQEIPPQFADYPAEPMAPNQKSVMPDVNLQSHPKANEHAKHLLHAMRRGPNFAGHYVLTSWDCGADCSTVAILDAMTGAVYFPKELAFFAAGPLQFEVDSTWANKKALTYQQNSNLLIISGSPTPDGETRKESGLFYYVWENGELNLIAQINTTTPKTLP
jgi:hypothetical protein